MGTRISTSLTLRLDSFSSGVLSELMGLALDHWEILDWIILPAAWPLEDRLLAYLRPNQFALVVLRYHHGIGPCLQGLVSSLERLDELDRELTLELEAKLAALPSRNLQDLI